MFDDREPCVLWAVRPSACLHCMIWQCCPRGKIARMPNLPAERMEEIMRDMWRQE